MRAITNKASRSKTRVVGYWFEGNFEEAPIEKLLTQAVADGTVTQFDTGRGRIVWFNGPPSEALRRVRDEVRRLI